MVQHAATCCRMVHLWTAAGSRESTLTGGVGLVRLSVPLVITSPIEYAYPNCDHLLSTLICRPLDCGVSTFRSPYVRPCAHTVQSEQWGGERLQRSSARADDREQAPMRGDNATRRDNASRRSAAQLVATWPLRVSAHLTRSSSSPTEAAIRSKRPNEGRTLGSSITSISSPT